MTPPRMSTCEIYDLAEESDLEDTFDPEVRMVTEEGSNIEFFDMAQTDADDNWTTCGNDIFVEDYMDKVNYVDYFDDKFTQNLNFLEDFIDDEIEEKNGSYQMQAVKQVEVSHDAILDLGADVSVLPMDMDYVGKMMPGGALLRDAQGKFIPVRGKASGILHCTDSFGNQVPLREVVVLANVRQPLIAIGKWMKKGWLITEFEEQFYLRKDEVYIPLSGRKTRCF